MRYITILLFPFLFILLSSSVQSCNADKDEKSTISNDKIKAEIPFDPTKWNIKKGKDYPYRDQMLDDVVSNEKIRKLNYGKLIDLLGEPERMNEGHLYYLISQKRIGSWALSTKTMVIKLTEDNTIEWIKIHGG